MAFGELFLGFLTSQVFQDKKWLQIVALEIIKPTYSLIQIVTLMLKGLVTANW